MPFTPKFADMVRNLTTVTGTGPVNPGSAVSGFTSIGAAVSAGDQFYYCIQGVDKPAEREVGRGTMQSNGTITREAISGGLTNFTVGTKTIALVAAAEWYAKVETGGSGGAGGGPSLAATVVALAALPTAAGAAALLTTKGREGLFVFDAANLSALVTADTRKGIYVAPAAAPTGSSGAWVRKFDGAVQLAWFGPAGDFVTNDLPAFEAAHDVIKARSIGGGYAGAGVLEIGPGRFYLAGTWNIHTCLQIRGAGSAQPYGAATLLRFGKNINGIVFNHGNTHGDGLGSQGSAEGSMLEGVQLWGGGVAVNGAGVVTSFAAGDSTSGNGVRIRGAFVACKDVASYFFGGSGFQIVATAGGGAYVQGNANSFLLERCQSQYNRGYGYEISGNDANAGKIDTCSAISCGAAGFIEYSFLGNSYIQCHVRDCGVTDPTGSNGPTGTCVYAGAYYYVVAQREMQASTEVPGSVTNGTESWRQFGGHPSCKTWVTGLTWINGAPYTTNPGNSNARNVFTGCYAESAQPPIQAAAPTLFVGGILHEVDFDIDSTALWLNAETGGLSVPSLSGRQNNISGAAPIPIDAIGRVWNATEPGGLQGSLHLRNAGGALTFGGFSGGGYAGAGIFTNTDGAFGTRMYIATTDSFGAGAKTAIAIDEQGDVDIVRGTLSVGGVPVAFGSPPASASAAEIRGGVVTAKFISPAGLFDAAAPVVLTDGASVTIDGATGINFNLTLGGNRTLANPTNMKPGQSGRIRVRQDATGSRTLAFGANWLFAGGDPTLSTAANAIDVIAYFANSATEIEATIVKALS